MPTTNSPLLQGAQQTSYFQQTCNRRKISMEPIGTSSKPTADGSKFDFVSPSSSVSSEDSFFPSTVFSQNLSPSLRRNAFVQSNLTPPDSPPSPVFLTTNAVLSSPRGDTSERASTLRAGRREPADEVPVFDFVAHRDQFLKSHPEIENPTNYPGGAKSPVLNGNSRSSLAEAPTYTFLDDSSSISGDEFKQTDYMDSVLNQLPAIEKQTRVARNTLPGFLAAGSIVAFVVCCNPVSGVAGFIATAGAHLGIALGINFLFASVGAAAAKVQQSQLKKDPQIAAFLSNMKELSDADRASPELQKAIKIEKFLEANTWGLTKLGGAKFKNQSLKFLKSTALFASDVWWKTVIRLNWTTEQKRVDCNKRWDHAKTCIPLAWSYARGKETSDGDKIPGFKRYNIFAKNLMFIYKDGKKEYPELYTA